MKRLLITCGLTLSLFNNVFAIPDVKLSAITALPGDSDELLLTISNNTDTAGLELKVTFDETQVSVGSPSNCSEPNSHRTFSQFIYHTI